MKHKTNFFFIFLIIFSFCMASAVQAASSGQISSYGSGQSSNYRDEYYSNGDHYAGEFVNGKYNGMGTYTWANGDSYTGQFLDGQINGTGKLTFSNGQYWEGIFVKGQISNGVGTFYWGSNGETFTGAWVNGQPHGEGKIRYPDGTTKTVVYNNGVLSNSGNSSSPSYGGQGQYSSGSSYYNPFQGLYAGGTVVFGSFEQDNNYSNGKEPIVWKVLTVSNGRALLLSQNLLEALPFNYSQVSVTWEGSTLRSWLNSTFYNDAFTAQEKSFISQTWNSNPNNSTYGTYGGNNTYDNVFLLSIDELKYYFPSEGSRKASPTAVARMHGAYGTADPYCAWWWLRSPGQTTACASSVNSIGVLLNTGPVVNDTTGGIRPAIWVNLGY